jgi:DNA-directed RNA polymerase specialized sigma24 family protein
MMAGAQLTPGQRQAIALRLCGYSRDVAATAMDRTPEAVGCLERRAIAHLRTAAGVR